MKSFMVQLQLGALTGTHSMLLIWMMDTGFCRSTHRPVPEATIRSPKSLHEVPGMLYTFMPKLNP